MTPIHKPFLWCLHYEREGSLSTVHNVLQVYRIIIPTIGVRDSILLQTIQRGEISMIKKNINYSTPL